MANSNKTPLLRPMRQTGSTMYVFPSASEDIGLNINSDSRGVALSDFVLLNFTSKNFSLTDPEDIARSLQNYAMNFETVLLNETDYSFQEPYTVSENVFWHWMTTHGCGTNTKDTDGTEHGFRLVRVPGTSNVWREASYETYNKDRMIQCLGSIDGGNSLSGEFGMFNETYVSVPTSYGNGPVFLRTVGNSDNVNYKSGRSYPSYTQSNPSYIQGRTSAEYSYLGLMAEYDDVSTAKYVTQATGDSFEVITDTTTIESTLRSLGASGISVSSYDDVNVDRDGALTTVDGYDMSGECEFRFNAILLYYSLYDLNDVYRQPVAKNLFGIVFLDGGSASGDYVISPVVKRKSYAGQSNRNAYFGNSYSFRVNIRTTGVYDNTDARIDDNTTTTSTYSQDFSDVISNLNRAIEVMSQNSRTVSTIQNEYMQIISSVSGIRSEVDALKPALLQAIDDKVSAATAEAEATLGDYVDGLIENAKAELKAYVDSLIG